MAHGIQIFVTKCTIMLDIFSDDFWPCNVSYLAGIFFKNELNSSAEDSNVVQVHMIKPNPYFLTVFGLTVKIFIRL